MVLQSEQSRHGSSNEQEEERHEKTAGSLVTKGLTDVEGDDSEDSDFRGDDEP